MSYSLKLEPDPDESWHQTLRIKDHLYGEREYSDAGEPEDQTFKEGKR